MRDWYFNSVIFGFILGVFFHSFIDFGFSFSLFIIFISAALFFITYFLSFEEDVKKYFFVGVLVCFSFALGCLRFDLSNWMHNAVSFSELNGKQVIIEGIIVDEPDRGEKNAKLTIETISVALPSGEKREAKEKILVTTDFYPEFFYGDRVEVKGKLEQPKNFTKEGERPFDYVAYLAKDNIFYTISFAKVTHIESGEGNLIKEKLFSIKNRLLKNLENILPDPHASLAGGLLVGGKNSIGEDLEKDFRAAGIIHIIVLSGYNIMIVAEYVMKVFSFLPRNGGIFAGGISIILFAVMTGGTATIVRAGMMALIALFARYVSRPYVITRALFFAGFLMILHNPKILVFDFSFQLSFLATIGLIYFSPLVERKLLFVTKKYNFREYVVSTIATQIIVLPLLLYRMGEMSLVSLPVNILILFLIPTTMLSSFLTSIAGFFSYFIALSFASLTYLFIEYELTIVNLFSKLPFASIKIDFFPLWLMVLLYLIYAILFYRIQKQPLGLNPKAILKRDRK